MEEANLDCLLGFACKPKKMVVWSHSIWDENHFEHCFVERNSSSILPLLRKITIHRTWLSMTSGNLC